MQSCCTFLSDGGLCLQAENANGLQRQLAGVADNFQIIKSDRQLQNTVQLGPLLSINADATCRPDGSSRTIVDISTLYAKLGPLRSAPCLSNIALCAAAVCAGMPQHEVPCDALIQQLQAALAALQSSSAAVPRTVPLTYRCCDDLHYAPGCRIPFPFRSNKDKGADQAFVDWLYLDDTMRITRGSKGSLFIHTRET